MCTGSYEETPRAGRQGGPLKAAFAAALALLVTGAAAPAADSFSTDWAHGAKSQARLIAAGEGLAGFEIALAPGAITYWRDPGDSGLPPTLDFSGSENVASVEIKFPAPKRIKEADGGEAFGYDGAVIFPLRVKPRDPANPVRLALNADFAVCEKVCLPAKARLSLTLPAAPDSPYAGAVGADSWRFCAPHEEGPPRDLFVEPPEGWWLKVAPDASEKGEDCFKLTLGDKPTDAALPVALRLTLTGGAGAVETTVQTRLSR